MTSKLRKLWKGAVLTATFIGATGMYSYKVEPQLLRTTKYDLATPKWPANEPPLHIAVAADFHVGSPSVDLSRLDKIVEAINAQKADIIVLPGDFVTMMDKWRVIGGKYIPPDQIAAKLKNLRAPLGVYAVLGNHDNENDPQGMREALEKAGIRVVDNDAAHVQKGLYDFWVAGLGDDMTGSPNWLSAQKKITNDAPVILIMHDPGAFLDKIDRPAVSLAGHTHGGQVLPMALQFFHNPFSRAPTRWLYGHISDDGRDLIVTSGIGTSIVPLRLGMPPEIADVEIHAPKIAKSAPVPQKPAPPAPKS